MRSPSQRRQVVLAGGLAALLVILAVLQWQWIGRWGAGEEARLQSTLRAGAADLDRDLSGRLLGLTEAFSQIPAADADAADTLAARLRAWRAASETPDLIGAVYWVRPGPQPTLARLDGDALRSTPWPPALAPWHRAATAFPARLAPAPGTDVARLTLDAADLPATPPGLLVPTLPPPTGDIRFVLVTLAPDVLAGTLLPALRARHLVGGDLFGVRLVSAADPSDVVYDGAPGAGRFDTPDLDVGVGPSGMLDLSFALAASPSASTEEASRQEILEIDEVSVTDTSSHRWRLLAQHRAGSIAAAAGGLRRRQLGLAFGVLAVLAAAVALLVTSARRQRALAARQLAFVAGVSHELRTPLSVLRTAGENLADGVVGGDDARRYGALVRDESLRLAEMVETVLTYAGADATAPRRTRVELADVVATALAQARPVLDEARTTVAVDLDGALPPLDADPAALATALRNLLANAARHGGRAVRVSARPATLGGAPAVALAVADDGSGFDAAEAVFEPFVRGHQAVDAQTPGSGLGLALVRRIAEAHGGAVEARTDGGAVVTLTLPAP